MAESIQEIFKRKLVPVRFERTMGLLGATTLGIGALMGAGIYVLIGLAAGKAGPAVWLSYLICGLLSLLSVYVFGELSRKIPIAGGGYAFAYNALGSFWGFITGWLLALGSIFACAMYAMGFGYYVGPLLPFELPNTALKGFGLIIIAVLTLLNCRGTKGGDRIQKILTWGNLAVLLILIFLAARNADIENVKPMFPQGLEGIGGAIAIIYVSFFGYQLIANTAEEIINPEKTVPRAMLLSMMVSLAFYVAVAITSVLVVPWENLAQSKAPLVEVAVKSLGRRGWLLIAVGGVLASAAALNSTLLSQARQIFAMGKNGFLPALLGRIHAVNLTPLAALAAGGIATAAALIFGDLTFIVKSANFCFLSSLLPASFALRKLYQASETTERPAGWQRYIPEASCLANLLLLITLDWVSIIFGLQLMGVGFLIYFFYSRKREVRSRTGMSLVLSEQQKSMHLSNFRILVPIANPQTQAALFAISESLLAQQSGELVVLNVVRATEQVDFHSALSQAEDSVYLLDGSTQLPTSDQVTVRPVVRVSRSLPKGIVHAAEEENCNLIVMGYAGEETSASIQLVEEVLNNARTDIILFKLRGEFTPKRIGVSLGGSSNLNLIVKLAGALADRYSGHITFMNILPEDYTAEQKAHSSKILMEAIKHHGANALYRIEVASSDRALDFLVERSAEFDLLVVGATKVKFLEKAAVGPFSSQIAMRSDCSVAIVRVASAVKKIMSI
ncbi:MAG: amino acid permease [Desulfobacterales bacterium]|jgi:amino acid transporter/nucleotide-binding universal stress UspA family protein